MKNKRDAALLNLALSVITAAAYLFKKRGKNFDNLTTHCLLVAVNNICRALCLGRQQESLDDVFSGFVKLGEKCAPNLGGGPLAAAATADNNNNSNNNTAKKKWKMRPCKNCI